MIAIRWLPPSAYPEMPLRMWFWSSAHDSGSWFWRVCGLEINVPRVGR